MKNGARAAVYSIQNGALNTNEFGNTVTVNANDRQKDLSLTTDASSLRVPMDQIGPIPPHYPTITGPRVPHPRSQLIGLGAYLTPTQPWTFTMRQGDYSTIMAMIPQGVSGHHRYGNAQQRGCDHSATPVLMQRLTAWLLLQTSLYLPGNVLLSTKIRGEQK